ncbi:Zinc finger protein 296, partial [Frankliniella fusca]
YYASVGLQAGPPPQRLAPPPGAPPGPPPGPPHKRARLMLPLARQGVAPGPTGSPGLKHALNGHLLNGVPAGLAPGLPHLQPPAPGPAPASPPLNGHHPAAINVFSNPDILICGNCREMYTDLQELLSHKKAHCKLRFACKCHTLPEGKSSHEATLLCSSCRASFSSAWDLMVHVQAAHMLNIYQLGVPEAADGQGEHTDLEPRSPTSPSPAGSGRQSQSPSSEPTPTPKSQQLAPISTAGTPPPQQLQPQALQQVDQTLSLTAAQLSPNQTNQQPLQQQQQPTQPASERLECPAAVTEASSASPSALSEPDEAVTPMLALGALGAASPAASTSSEHEAAVVVGVGATLQCNLKAEPLKAEDEVLLSSSPEPQAEAAWGAQEV